ncbi:MAG: hypothetical protein ACREJ0_30585 [Geminicoccaceae bacterium]
MKPMAVSIAAALLLGACQQGPSPEEAAAANAARLERQARQDAAQCESYGLESGSQAHADWRIQLGWGA